MVSRYFDSQASSEQQGGVATARIATGDVANPMLEQDDERFRFRWIPEPVRDVGSGLGRVFSELDRPISERMGFEFPDARMQEQRGPIDEIGNFALGAADMAIREATRPTNLLFALPGVALGSGLTRAALSAPRMAKPFLRGARTLVEPFGGWGTKLPARIGAEAAANIGGRAAVEKLDETMPDNISPFKRTVALVGAGLVGGAVGGGGLIGGLRRAGISATDNTAANIMKATLQSEKMAATPAGRQAIYQVIFDALENPSKRLSGNEGRGDIIDLQTRRQKMLDESNISESQREWLQFLVGRQGKFLNTRQNPDTKQWENKSMEDILHDFERDALANPESSAARAKASYTNTFKDDWLSASIPDDFDEGMTASLLQYRKTAAEIGDDVDASTIANYLEVKARRGVNSEIEEALQIGQDENLMRALYLDEVIRKRLVADPASEFKEITREDLNPILRYMSKLGLYKLNGYASELTSKYYLNARAGDNYRNSVMGHIRSIWDGYNLNDIVEMGPRGMRFKEGHIPKIVNGRYQLTTEGATMPFTKRVWNSSTRSYDEVEVEAAMTVGQLQTLETIVRSLSDLQRAEIGSGIDPALVGRKAGRLPQQGRRETKADVEAARQEIAIAQQEDDVRSAITGDDTGPIYENDLARELADFDFDNEILPFINDKNPLFGDVLELGEWNSNISRYVDDRGGYIPRKLQGGDLKKALTDRRQSLDTDTEFTQARTGTVQWRHEHPMESTMDEMLEAAEKANSPNGRLVEKGYESDVLAIIDERFASGLNRINDEWLTRQLTLVGRTKTELMQDYAGSLAHKRSRIAAKMSYLGAMSRRAGIRAEAYSRAPSELRRQERELQESLDKIQDRLAKLADSREDVDFDMQVASQTADLTKGATFRAQTALEITDLVNQNARIMRQILQAENELGALQEFIKGNKSDIAQYGRRIGGLKSTLKKFREGNSQKQGMVELQEEFDAFLKQNLGEGWAFGPTTEGGTHLDPAVWQITTSSPIRNAEGEIVMNPSGSSRTAIDFYNREGIPPSRVVTPEEFLEEILPVMNASVLARGGRIRDPRDLRRNISPKELDKQFKSMFKKRIYQEQAINRMMNNLEEYTLVRDNIIQKVSEDGAQVSRLESFYAGVVATQRTEVGASMERIKNLFDSGVQTERLNMSERMLKKNSTLRQAWDTMGEKEAARAAKYEKDLIALRTQKEGLDLQYEREFKNVVDKYTLSQIPTVSNRLGGNRYFDEAMAAEIGQSIAPIQQGGGIGATLDALNAFNNMMRPIMATLDASAMGIQGLLALGTNPIQAMQTMNIATRSVLGNNKLWTGFVSSNYSERALGERSIQAYIRKGGYWSPEESVGEFLINDTAMNNGVFNKIPMFSKAARKSNMHFSRTGNMLRFMLYRNAIDNGQTMRLITTGFTKSKLTEQQERDIIQTINEATGWKNVQPSSIEQSLLFAPRFFRSQIEVIAKAMKGVSPESQLAREMLVRTVSLGALFTITMNEMRGEKTDYNPIKYDINGNPYYNTNFMRIRNVMGTDISVFGPWDTMAGMMVSLFTEGWFSLSKRTLENKASPAVGAIWDLARGYNFDGEPTRAFGDPKQLVQTIWANGNGFLPFSTQEMLDPLGADTPLTASPIFGFLGIKSSPTTAKERRDYAASEWISTLDSEAITSLGMETDEVYGQYDQLTGTAQQRFDSLFPEHRENMELNKKKFAIRGEVGTIASMKRGDIRASRMEEIESVWNHYKSGQHPVQTISQVLERVSEINRETSVKYQQLDETLDTEIKNPDLSDPNQRAISEFYGLYDEAEIANTGIMDWQMYDVLLARFYDGLTEGQRKYVDNRRVSLYPPELRPYISAKSRVARSGFYSLGDQIYVRNRARLAPYLKQAGYPVPISSWSSFDALFTQMKTSHPKIAVDLNNRQYIKLNGEVTALKDRMIATNRALKKDLELIGRRTPENYSLMNQRAQRFR